LVYLSTERAQRRMPDDVGVVGPPAAAAAAAKAVAMTTCGHRASRVNQYICGNASRAQRFMPPRPATAL